MTAPCPERPAAFEGVIDIDWPQGPDGVPASGWAVAAWLGGVPLTAVRRIDVHAEPRDLPWAELTMLTDAEGRFLRGAWDAMRADEDGNVAEATFPFLLGAMRVRPAAEISAALRAALKALRDEETP